MYKVIPKFLQKYNKKLKKNRRALLKYEFGKSKESIGSSSFEPEIIELTKYVLEGGNYIVQFDDSTYGIYVNNLNNVDAITSDIYFIGDSWKKYRNKFRKMLEYYERLCEYKAPEVIQGPRGRLETMFKSFDKFIMTDKDKVLKYVDNWVDNIPKYHEKYEMIPKLSILLYGVPGTGKSTFYKALAKYLDIKNVQLVDNQFLCNNKQQYSYGYSSTIYAIDDIDCMVKSRSESKGDNNQVLQSLLEFLDNPPSFQFTAKNGKSYPVQIVVATTNYYDKLDPAVRRYGRFDLQIEMGEFDKKMAQAMCDLYDLKLENVVPDSDKKNFKITPAKLQALCMNRIDDKLKDKKNNLNGLIEIHRIK